MNEVLSISVIVGFFLSPAIDAINREKWSAQLQAISAFVICMIAAVATDLATASFNWHDLRGVIIAVFSAAIISFHAFWKPSGISGSISKTTG